MAGSLLTPSPPRAPTCPVSRLYSNTPAKNSISHSREIGQGHAPQGKPVAIAIERHPTRRLHPRVIANSTTAPHGDPLDHFIRRHGYQRSIGARQLPEKVPGRPHSRRECCGRGPPELAGRHGRRTALCAISRPFQTGDRLHPARGTHARPGRGRGGAVAHSGRSVRGRRQSEARGTA